ncbi:hypothetical protein SAMN05421820_102340 [Pedobacter steynii]|uniref:Uncharacterized protein n=1 Tax=Pedobacter steynii TaxID=430522 RepID=A0A1G9NK13_9SPHI|nr:hypothetical protein [Pedobacter steynii]NQX39288.1 hypothetical protein [Pedobacter steynii]SDL86325.1 hypothetical protein SAMN05421820_102340 [Pedobacter steynii]
MLLKKIIKKINTLSYGYYLGYVVFSCCVFTSGKVYGQVQSTYFIEAEDFQFPAGWVFSKEAGTNVSGKGALFAAASKDPVPDALTVISVKTKGSFFVWTRSRDYADNKPGTRKYLLSVNEQDMNQESGAHLGEGYAWEKVGRIDLDAGENVLRLKNTSRNFVRCDALLFSTDGAFNPNKESSALATYAIKPTQVKETPAVLTIGEAVSFTKKEKLLGTLSNDQLKLSFEEVLDEKTGKRQIVATTAVFQDKRWATLTAGVEENRIFLLSTKKAAIEFGAYFASWKNSASLTEFVVKGKTYKPMDQNGAKNPFLAAELSACLPTAVKQVSPEELWVTYLTDKGQEVKGVWKLKAGASHYELSLTYSAREQGFYSFVVSAFQDVTEAELKNVQLPPMFNYKRLPTGPIMIPGAMTPQPLAIVEVGQNNRPLSFFVTGSLTDFPLDWGKDYSSLIGFSLKNAFNKIQPVAFAPVLGLEDSKLQAGQSLKRTFNLGAVPENWNGALEYISNSIYQVKDYRSQDSSSLTNAAFNMIDLIKNDDASGWNAELKGFYDIEADPKIAPTVAQSAPLAVISAAIIGRDEALYLTRALPTIEYTLSRSAFRWAKAVGAPYNLKEASLVLDPYKNVQFNTAYFDALNQLLEQKNPWLVQVGMPDQQPRKLSGYSVNLPAWTQELAAYRLTKDKQWLDKAVLHAKEFVQKEVYGQKTQVLTVQPFYNTSFYPYWWDLMDLYEINKDKVFLDAAKYASFFTIAGIRSYPAVQNQKQLIHEGGRYEGNTNLWWKEGKKFRLGFPRIDGDVIEKEVPQALVSPVGLGLEQPVTFFLPNKNVRHIFMSTWAPHLLRLSAESNKDIFEIYARNSIIGRFSNYPGYYATGYTDLTYRADYPYKGPDINSIYYHHISPHLAFTLDFLVTEAIQRSKGSINFPWGKQEGFVWFNNRVYGAGKGTIFDDSRVKLWLKKGLVNIDNPAINYITGISDDRFWLVLLNEAQQEQQFEIGLDLDQVAVKSTGVKFYKGTSAESIVLSGKKMKSVIGGKGLTAYSFPLQQPVAEKVLLPVKNGMQEVNIGGAWGKLHAFRIRSPFGWDSIYAYLSTPPLAGAEAEMDLNEDSATIVKRTGYPFEWSFSRIDPAKPASISLKLKRTGSAEVQQVDVVFDIDKK